MAMIIDNKQVKICIKQELELAGISIEENKHAVPDLGHLLPELRYTIIEAVLIHTRGNQSKAARMLGINRATLCSIVRGYLD
ncbi:TPA: helix-turn-helix domain-containing protein [Vibrio parahaemolyticus]